MQPRVTDTAVWRSALARLEAIDSLDDPFERSNALEVLAGEDPRLHDAVLALIGGPKHGAGMTSAGDDLEDTTLGLPPLDPLAHAAQAFHPVDLTGQIAGAYRFVRPLGAGGMGQVWLAERVDGRFEGQVAVKLLDWSSSPALVARFRREGQLLARLSHPHIARLLDAGAMPSGQLYLVLEVVDGLRLDEHADRARLTVAQRLRLFLDVCAAVSQAHANLIVHRDLKPSNILVSREGIVKLVDFGIAKLLEAEHARGDATELTHLAGQAMTLEYAAPEQVNGEAVTTATDVYALGVVLYRLLCGATPYPEVSDRAALARAVVGTEPLALAARELPPDVALARATTPERLRAALTGDLETIVLEALKKAPAERYGSVQALADDIRRHLAHEPVLARPDTLRYRARKFVRRNRMQVAALSAVFLSLVAGITATTWQWQAATREAQRTRSVVRVLTDVFTDVHPNRSGSVKVPMNQLLERGWRRARKDLAHDPDLQGEVARSLGLLMRDSGESEATAQALEVAREHMKLRHRIGETAYLEVAVALATVWQVQGRVDDALRLTAETIQVARDAGLADAPEAIDAMTIRASLLRQAGHHDQARTLFEDIVDKATRIHGPTHASTLRPMAELAELARNEGRWDDARALYARTLASMPPDARTEIAATRLQEAALDVDLGLYASAATKLRRLATTMEELFGEASDYTALTRSWLAVATSHAGEPLRALQEMDTAIDLARRGAKASFAATLQLTRARLLVRAGQAREAADIARETLDRLEGAASPDAGEVARSRSLLGDALMRLGSPGEGRRHLQAAADTHRQLEKGQPFQRLHAMMRHGVAVDLEEGALRALAHYREAAELGRSTLQGDHPERLRAEILLAHAQHRLDPTPQRADLLRDKLAALAATQAVRAETERFSVYRSRMLAARPSPAADAADLFSTLDF